MLGVLYTGRYTYRNVHVSEGEIAVLAAVACYTCITRCEASTEQDKLALVRLLLRLGLHTVARSLSVQAASRDQNLNQVAGLATLGQVRLRGSSALWCECGLLKVERYGYDFDYYYVFSRTP